tara:strand:+ start:10266 stop:11417 length:1152 start_codon:yes stop_codon:yes gene_type:complete
MRIAFYPLKEFPNHPNTLTEQVIMESLIKTLQLDNNIFLIPNEFNGSDNKRYEKEDKSPSIDGEREANNKIRKLKRLPVNQRPQIWITYNLNVLSPDSLGPKISSALNIPYIIIGAKYSKKHLNSSNTQNLTVIAQQISHADVLLSFSYEETSTLIPIKSSKTKIIDLPPFVDFSIYEKLREKRVEIRQRISKKYNLCISRPWLVTVAMLNPGNNLASYRLLGRSLWLINKPNFNLLIVGEGPAQKLVKESFKDLEVGIVAWIGKQGKSNILEILTACDIYVWPGYNEYCPIQFLMSQAAGLPVITGGFPGATKIIQNSKTGNIIIPWDDADFAESIVRICDDKSSREKMSSSAIKMVRENHSLSIAKKILNQAMSDAFKNKN